MIRSITISEPWNPVLCFRKYRTRMEVISISPTASAASQTMTVCCPKIVSLAYTAQSRHTLKLRNSVKVGVRPTSYAVQIPATKQGKGVSKVSRRQQRGCSPPPVAAMAAMIPQSIQLFVRILIRQAKNNCTAAAISPYIWVSTSSCCLPL